MDEAEVAFFLAEYLIVSYPELLLNRYELEELPTNPVDFFEAIGQKRGKIRSGGRVDINEISKDAINLMDA